MAKAARTKKRKRGRPREFGERIANKTCEGVAEGKSLREVCEGRGMPSEATVRGRVLADPKFAACFQRAVADRAARWGEQLVELADAEPPPRCRRQGGPGLGPPTGQAHRRAGMDHRQNFAQDVWGPLGCLRC